MPAPFNAERTTAWSDEGSKLLTHGQSAGRDGLVNEQKEKQQEQASMTGLNPLGQPQLIGKHEYPAPTSFNDVHPGRFRLISTIPSFSRTAVLADSESGFELSAQYAWDSEFFSGIPVAALSSRL